MPRVTKRKARKDYPDKGIAKGEMYYYWKVKLQRGGVTGRSKTYPKPSQLNFGFTGQLGDIEQSFEAAEDIDGLRSISEEIRELGAKQQDKFDNMPEGLQQGDTGQTLEERATQCEEWADSIDTACDEADSKITALEELESLWTEHDAKVEADEEPEEPEDERPDNNARADILQEAKDQAGSPF